MAQTGNLPNLKISVENSGANDDVVQLEDIDQDDTLNIEEENENQVEVKVNLDNLAPSNNQRDYKNPQATIVEGQDLKEIQKKLQGRASRFGLKDDEVSKKFCEITEDDIKQLYESLKVTETDNKSRLNAIHIRGVEEMSTENVFSYFNKFFPESVEWINDVSCNVLWSKEEDAAKAMILLSVKIIKEPKNVEKTTSKEDENEETPKESERELTKNDCEMDNVVVMSNDDEVDYFDCEMDTAEESHVNKTVNESDVGAPIPPGNWRLGIPHEKAKAILFRFANKDDRKIKGAEKISKYYKKYGNPNFNGLQGIISNSKKRKLKLNSYSDFEKTFQAEDRKDSDSETGECTPESSDTDELTDGLRIEERLGEDIAARGMSKIPRQKMYADIEEDRRRNLRKRIAITAPLEEVDDEDDLRTLLKNKRRKGTPSAFSRLSYGNSNNIRHDFHKGDSTDLRSKLSVRSRVKHRSTFSIDEESDESKGSD